MRWPWSRRRPEARAAYTDAIVGALLAQASGGSASTTPLGLASVETACGLYGRAFASAALAPDVTALTPSLLAGAVRSVLRRGEWVAAIEVVSGVVRLLPVASWDVAGSDPDPATWLYRCDLPAPSGTVRRTLPAGAVIHLQFASDPGRPWIGVSPIAYAAATGRLAAALERSLADESGGPVGHVVPMPPVTPEEDDDDTDPYAATRTDLGALRGGLALVDSVADGGGDRLLRPDSDWRPRRIGPNYPEAEVTLRAAVEASVCVAYGIPAAYMSATSAAAIRESWRAFIVGAVEPLARQFAVELGAKLDAPGLEFDFGALRSADVTGRARAVASLVTAGVSVEDARAAVGI